ncbi:hypothetical protein AX16_005780 [Volvariella volvacea WC 439]|nr:hypothetical protein AX16_005780 [Volvariella volvacea WC 439]
MTSPLARRVSLNLDVVEEILSYFTIDTQNPDTNWRANTQNLLNIALTCQQYKEPALSVLWHSLDTLDPLLCLLPQIEKQGNISLFNGSRPKSWAKFDSYAEKVKEFKYRPPPVNTMPQIGSLAHTSVSKARGFFLPNIRSLFFDLRSAQSIQNLDGLLPALLEPTLRGITIWNSDTYLFDTFPLLSALRFTCEDVQFISVRGSASNSALDVISSFPKLRQCTYIPYHGNSGVNILFHNSFISALAQSPQLQELTLDLTRCSFTRFSVRSGLSFTLLKRLSLHGHPKSMISVVNYVQSAGISDLSLRLECRSCVADHDTSNFPHMKWDQVNSMLDDVSKRWSRSMDSLKLYARCNQIGGTCHIETLMTHITTMTRLRSLELLDDYNRFPSIPNTQAWDRLQSKLPCLEVLHLPRTSVLSLPRIHHALSYLPRLQSLGVAISLDEIPLLEDLPPLNHDLRTLSIGQSVDLPNDQQKIRLVLCHLYSMVPNLREVQHHQSHPGWAQVQPMLAMFRTVAELQKQRLKTGLECKCLTERECVDHLGPVEEVMSPVNGEADDPGRKLDLPGSLQALGVVAKPLNRYESSRDRNSDGPRIVYAVLVSSLLWLFATSEPTLTLHVVLLVSIFAVLHC